MENRGKEADQVAVSTKKRYRIAIMEDERDDIALSRLWRALDAILVCIRLHDSSMEFATRLAGRPAETCADADAADLP